MTRAQSNVWGEAKALVRELGHNPTPELVHRINSQFPHHIPRILGQFTLEQQARLGISMTRDQGRLAKLVLAETVGSDHPPAATERRSATPAEIAKALNKGRQAPDPEIAHNPPVYIIGYGKPVAPSSVTREWNAANAAADKVGVMRRAVAIREAEVSMIPHSGSYDQVHSDDDGSVVERHAGKLLISLTRPAPQSERIRWSSQGPGSEPQYSLQHMPLGDTGDERILVLVRSQPFGQATETGAVFGDFRHDDARYSSPGRTFTLRGDTAFAIDPVLAAELTDGAELSANESFALGGDAAAVVEEFLGTEDVAILAPAYTKYVMTQQLAAA